VLCDALSVIGLPFFKNPSKRKPSKDRALAPDLAAQTLKIQGDAQKPQSRHIDALSAILAHKD